MTREALMLPISDSEPRRELGASFGAPATAGEELGLDDAGLIAEYLAGNPAAYGELVRRHQIAIFRLLLGLTANEDLAEEGCEKVFLLAERRLAELTDGNTFAQWLLAIAREVSVKLDERTALDETAAPETADPRERLKREIHAVLQRLAPDQRLVLVLVELRGASDEDVAAALGCARDEVADLIAAARAEFARILGSRAAVSTVPGTHAERAAAAPRLREGDPVADRYRVKRLIAEGGMGAVYVAVRISDGEEVAIKTVLPGLITDDDSLRRFGREIEAIKRVHHENFVRVLDHGRSGEFPFLVMELLRGRSLAALILESASVEPMRALELMAEVLRGLVHAHGVGVIHRDLKPENVFVVDGEGERVKLLDLGLAKLVLDEEGHTRTALTERGMVFGTPSYMSPEQALGEEVDHRADLYAVAVMLFQLLTGRLPFESMSAAAVLVMHVSSPPPSLAEFAPHLADSPLQGLLDRGLAKRREDRHADAAQFLVALEACRDTGTRTTSPGPREQTTRALSAEPTVTPIAVRQGTWRPGVLLGCLLMVFLAGAGYPALSAGRPWIERPSATPALPRTSMHPDAKIPPGPGSTRACALCQPGRGP
jgi:serine/threonine protein kinase/DNA-directed RNA polymerase specialized sigma24 family protein